jgi:SAM-dependent methyltransferase
VKGHSTFGYGLAGSDAASIAIERERLALLSDNHDRASARLLTDLGLTTGWRCLEIGTGQGSMARWLAEAVGDDGQVLATDLDLQFVGAVPENVDLIVHDIGVDPLPASSFDLVHARAVLQHVAARETALANMVSATRPGGWVVVEDIDWLVFEEQPLPEPFATLHRTVRDTYSARAGYDGYWGRRMLAALTGAGLVGVESTGRVTTMRGGQPSAEWYVMALERARQPLVEADLLDAAVVDRALAQARDPSFAVLSPLMISAWGRKPGLQA